MSTSTESPSSSTPDTASPAALSEQINVLVTEAGAASENPASSAADDDAVQPDSTHNSSFTQYLYLMADSPSWQMSRSASYPPMSSSSPPRPTWSDSDLVSLAESNSELSSLCLDGACALSAATTSPNSASNKTSPSQSPRPQSEDLRSLSPLSGCSSGFVCYASSECSGCTECTSPSVNVAAAVRPASVAQWSASLSAMVSFIVGIVCSVVSGVAVELICKFTRVFYRNPTTKDHLTERSSSDALWKNDDEEARSDFWRILDNLTNMFPNVDPEKLHSIAIRNCKKRVELQQEVDALFCELKSSSSAIHVRSSMSSAQSECSERPLSPLKYRCFTRRASDSINFLDPVSVHIRLAEGAFLRGINRLKSWQDLYCLGSPESAIETIDYVENDALMQKYKEKRAFLSSQLGHDCREVLLFYSTPASNVESVLKEGFRVERMAARAFGRGIYLREVPSVDYDLQNRLILCRVLLGRVQSHGSQLELSESSVSPLAYHSYRTRSKWAGWGFHGEVTYVIAEEDQVLPYCVITLNRFICVKQAISRLMPDWGQKCRLCGLRQKTSFWSRQQLDRDTLMCRKCELFALSVGTADLSVLASAWEGSNAELFSRLQAIVVDRRVIEADSKTEGEESAKRSRVRMQLAATFKAAFEG